MTRGAGARPIRSLPALCALVLTPVITGCGGPPGAAPVPSSAAAPRAAATHRDLDEPEAFGPARLFPPLRERVDLTFEGIDSDGSRRVIAQGLRLIQRPDGALTAASEFLPSARNVTALELPERLGGGFLFVVNTSGTALLFGSGTFTGPLRAFGSLSGDVERVVAGLDRLYVLRSRSSWLALDLETGKEIGLGSLPPSPGYGSMAFADPWLGAVELPLRGVVATFDAGQTWHPLEQPRAQLSAVGAGVLVETAERRFVLGPLGTMTPWRAPAAPPAAPVGSVARAASSDSKKLELQPIGANPLESAVLHGVLEPGAKTALVATLGTLARVRLSDGAVLASLPEAYPGAAPCTGFPFRDGVGFACGEVHAKTIVYALAPPFTLAPALGFDTPRRVAPNGRGALVIDGACSAGDANPKLRCIVPRVGEPFEIELPAPTVRVVALDDGRAALLEPPRPRFAGTLTFVSASGAASPLPLKLPKLKPGALATLVSNGFWLDAFEQAASGALRGWIAGGATFTGVRIGLDGQVELGEPQPGLDRSLLAGRFALVVGRGGGARETSDGGFDWSDAEFPAEPDWSAARTFGQLHGCRALGCALSGWLRVGWGMGARGKLPVAAVPDPISVTSAGAYRWSLECTPSREVSKPALRVLPELDNTSVSPWNPLAEVAPPTRAPADASYDTGSELELRLFRGYAWGPAGDAWTHGARWLVRVRDPYRVSESIWSSAVSGAPWPRAELTADAFGRSPNGPASTWRVVTDPVKHAGLVLVSAKGTVELYSLEAGRALSRLKAPSPIGVITGVAVAGNRLYVGALGEARSFRVFRANQGSLEFVAEFPNAITRSEPPKLAPATRGDGLGLWVHDADHYLYPLDPASGRLDAPLVTRAGDLSSMPEACNPEEDGYVIADALSLEPNIELLEPGKDASVGNGIEVRVIASPGRLCVDGLAAPLGSSAVADAEAQARGRGDGGVDLAGRRARPGQRSRKTTPEGEGPKPQTSGVGVRLVLNMPNGARQGFRCRD
jgi:hypothetical protein